MIQFFIFHTRTSQLNCSKSVWRIQIADKIRFASWWTMNRMTIDDLWYWIRRKHCVHMSNSNSRNQSNECCTTNVMMYDIHRKIFENDSVLNMRQFAWFRYNRKHEENRKSRIKENWNEEHHEWLTVPNIKRFATIQQRRIWTIENRHNICERFRNFKWFDWINQHQISHIKRYEDEDCWSSSRNQIVFIYQKTTKWHRTRETELASNITMTWWKFVAKQTWYTQNVVCAKNSFQAQQNISEETNQKMLKELFSHCVRNADA